ncbi:transporter substrate-binding domain-containing protein [Caenimonas sedimenti]|uniref:Transporter substrate-binding domain-containing protein n=1 Tax=Caenimonas sedimenti TaxID=2596921 RepID=A0A562ZQJ2_9BURK|nr:transporter substrate-binding domain-containing protein [Caenimonas sedimenti]TWO70870.1 transporter substrate-binding domain-containing protein [Caenimonas sedimenti]
MRRRAALGTFVLTALLLGCATAPPVLQANEEVRRSLAPTGTLRIAVFTGSPMSMVRDAASGRTLGVAYELGTALAARLGVPHQLVEFGTFADVAAALASGQADIGMFNASSPRASEVWLAPTLLSQEASYLVPGTSSIMAIADVDKPGVRVGVQQNSSSQGLLARTLKSATLVPLPNLQNVPQMFAAGQLGAFATNKGILFDLSDRVPASRILEGSYAIENQTLAIPKGREAGGAYLAKFLDEARSSGLVKASAERARLRGVLFR